MKLLVSDYDGTLHPKINSVENLNLNIDAINKFRQEGNKFMLATGRNMDSIAHEIFINSIKYDYLSCNDGCILFASNDDIMYANFIDINTLSEVYNVLDMYSISNKRITFYGTNGIARVNDKILEVSINTFNLPTKEIINRLLDISNIRITKFPELLFIHMNNDKTTSIKYLENLYDFDEIITVGDSTNDFEMLTEYNGYKMLVSHPSLYFKGIKTTPSVRKLIKK